MVVYAGFWIFSLEREALCSGGTSLPIDSKQIVDVLVLMSYFNTAYTKWMPFTRSRRSAGCLAIVVALGFRALPYW